ncbi:LLM class flavin-dependent oxidoreductase [Aquabacter sp. CN5-332]|uniref:LLM class flavin-dependent oxidoreductase n=1 Tax=Aquabacter sp. CN5-332 TaxID=3156608 RepID=UPI0032B47411
MSGRPPRFGIWALAHGVFGSRHHPGEVVDASWKRNRTQVIEAERLGYDSTLILQHTISPQGDDNDVIEAWTAAAALAEATSRIEIIAAIKPLLYHPAVLAKMALQIEAISRGRFAINFVNAWYKPEIERAGIPFPDHDDRYEYGAEWLEVAAGLIEGRKVTFKGKHFDVRDYVLSPKSEYRERPTVYVSGESEPARAIAAQTGDVYFLNSRPLEEIAEFIADLSARPRSRAPLRFAMPAFVIARPTEVEAEEEIAYARELFVKDLPVALNREKHTDAKSRMLFQTHEKLPQIGIRGGTASGLVGSYEQVARRIAQFNEIGIETFMLQFQPFEAEMKRFAEEIIPRVRRLERRAG